MRFINRTSAPHKCLSQSLNRHCSICPDLDCGENHPLSHRCCPVFASLPRALIVQTPSKITQTPHCHCTSHGKEHYGRSEKLLDIDPDVWQRLHRGLVRAVLTSLTPDPSLHLAEAINLLYPGFVDRAPGRFLRFVS